MEKRILLAIVISLGVLYLWAAAAPKLFPEMFKKPAPPKPAATLTAPPATTTAATASPTTTAPGTTTSTAAAAPGVPVGYRVDVPNQPAPAVAETKPIFTEIKTHYYTARFRNAGAQLVSYKLNDYKAKDGKPVELVKERDPRRTDYPFFIQSPNADLANTLNSALYAVTVTEDRGSHTIVYRYRRADGLSMTKIFRLGEEYLFEWSTAMSPREPYRVMVGPGIRTLAAEEKDSQIVITGNGVVQQAGEIEILGREKGDQFQIFEGVEFAGIEDNYFLTVLRPTQPGTAVFSRREYDEAQTKTKRKDQLAGLNATNGAASGQAFFGPKEADLMDRYGLSETLQFGWFGFIARFFLKALVYINTTTKNYGWAIVVLTILIKIVLYPLQHKSNVSMKKMQKLQPKMEAIKAKYKKHRSDPEQRQKMNVEVMQLYQKEGINPMGGCLPLVLQLPILWAFYGLLSRAIELRGADFVLWIKDLSDKDPYYVLPILMTVSWLAQTAIMPATGDPMQRRIFMVMPIVFGFFFKDFPSGLVLYWLVQNVLTIIQQLIMNKWWKDHPSELQNA